MKKACKYCGKIHEMNYICEKKPELKSKRYSKKYERKEDIFRSSYEWQKKRTYILKRDKYLCQACLYNLFGTVCHFTTDDLSVHHIRPLRTDFDLRLDDSNLITLCKTHHKFAENGRISAKQLLNTAPPIVDDDFKKS